jgi:hypothetical protein
MLMLGNGDASESRRDDAAFDRDVCCGCGLPHGLIAAPDISVGQTGGLGLLL